MPTTTKTTAPPKSVFASSTAWFGAALTVLGALQSLDWAQLIPNNPHVVGMIGTGIGLAVIGLRFISTRPVSISGS